jgi:hypothetical protein
MSRPSRTRMLTATLRSWTGNLLILAGLIGLGLAASIPLAGLDFLELVAAMSGAALASALVGSLGRYLAMTGRKQRAALTANVWQDDSRSPVLYLRSFADDEVLADANVVKGFVQTATEEEAFAKVLNRVGPFVAIGDPREGLPTLGASRLYVGNTDWQMKVRELLVGAQLVVLRVSSTQGLLWELQHVVTAVHPTRFLLFIPGEPKHYEAIRRLCDRWLPQALPDLPRSRHRLGTLQAIVRFRPDWTPEFLPCQFSLMRCSLRSPLSPHLLLTLRPVFEQLGVPWSKPRLSVMMLFFATLSIAILGWIVVGSLLDLWEYGW